VVDTDVASYLFKGDSRSRWYRPRLARRLWVISFMTLAELHQWALVHHWGQDRRERLERFLGSFTVYDSDGSLCRLWAEIMTAARQKGRSMEVADAWTAAVAVALNTPLVTHNAADYAGVDGLTVLTAPAL
jgi:tRNA(fMet)-specific endonuclease VapC